MDGFGVPPDSRLIALVGQEIESVARVFYVFQGAIEPTDGPLEIGHRDGVILFECGGDGQSLSLSTSRWSDLFAPPLSAENEAFVAECGCWRRFDCSKADEYSALIGSTIESVETRKTEMRDTIVRVTTSSRTFEVELGGDECHVKWLL